MIREAKDGRGGQRTRRSAPTGPAGGLEERRKLASVHPRHAWRKGSTAKMIYPGQEPQLSVLT